MKSVYLIQVVDNYGPNKFLPLALGYQWTNALQDSYIKNNYFLADVLIEKIDIPGYLDSISDPDIILMSCYVWSWNYNCRLAEEIKKRWPNSIIVIGGPQVPKNDFLLFKKFKFFDIGILGENENALIAVLKNTEDKNFNQIPGIVLPGRLNSQVVRTKNLNDLPSPILTGFYDDIIRKYKKQMEGNISWQVTFETMRGCPYHCAFCDIGDQYWNKTILFDIERIYKEIDWMSENQIEYVTVCDSNWGLFERDYEITEYVIKKKIETGYPKIWDVTWSKSNHERVRRIAELDKKYGTKLFKGVTFALQSLNQQTLDFVDRFNLPESVIRSSMSYFKSKDIPTYSELIWPMPGETVESFKEGLQKLVDLGQEDFVMVHPLVLTPNSPMGQSSYIRKYNLVTIEVPLDTFWLKIDDPKNYVIETVQAVVSTDSVTQSQMIQGHLFAHWFIVMYYYGWAHFIIKYLKNKLKITETNFIDDLIFYIKTCKPKILYKEHVETERSLNDVLDKFGFWGRMIEGVYWEYKSATCVTFHLNRNAIKEEISEFLKHQYNITDNDLIDLNFDMCFDWRQRYPIKKRISKELSRFCFNTECNKIQIYHEDQSLTNDLDFIKKVYHYQRKNRYWKCSIDIVV